MTRVFFIALMTLALASSEAQTTTKQPPVAKKVHTQRTLNGVTLTDDYAWLRERDNPDVNSYLEAENAYAEQMTAALAPVRQKLYDEIVSHIKETDDTVPYLKDGYYYYTRTEKGKQYFVLCRKQDSHPSAPKPGALGTPESIDAPEQVLLDLNVMGEGQPFMALGPSAVSDDGNWLAYTTDNVGFRQYKLHIRDLRTGKDLPDIAERVTSVAWASDNKTLFYTIEDEVQKRSYRLYRHTAGTDTAKDPLLYEEADERFNINVDRTRSREFVTLFIGSHVTTEMRFLPAAKPEAEWRTIEPRRDNIEYYADHRGDQFYIRTNDKAQTFRIVTAPVASPGREHWKELIASRPGCAHRRHRRLPELLRRDRAAGRISRVSRGAVCRWLDQANRVSRARVLCRRPGERRVQHQGLSLSVSVADYAAIGLRLQRRNAPVDAAEAE